MNQQFSETLSKPEFFKMFTDFYTSIGYSFFVPGGQPIDPKETPLGAQTIIGTIASLALGFVNPGLGAAAGISCINNLSEKDKQSLAEDLTDMRRHCDAIGIKLSGIASANLVLGIDADDISDETLVGRFVVVHEKARNFVRYSHAMFGNRSGVTAWGCLVFSSHNRAREFTDTAAKRCKHSIFWKSVYTKPWIYDLEQDSARIRAKFSGRKEPQQNDSP